MKLREIMDKYIQCCPWVVTSNAGGFDIFNNLHILDGFNYAFRLNHNSDRRDRGDDSGFNYFLIHNREEPKGYLLKDNPFNNSTVYHASKNAVLIRTPSDSRMVPHHHTGHIDYPDDFEVEQAKFYNGLIYWVRVKLVDIYDESKRFVNYWNMAKSIVEIFDVDIKDFSNHSMYRRNYIALHTSCTLDKAGILVGKNKRYVTIDDAKADGNIWVAEIVGEQITYICLEDKFTEENLKALYPNVRIHNIETVFKQSPIAPYSQFFLKVGDEVMLMPSHRPCAFITLYAKFGDCGELKLFYPSINLDDEFDIEDSYLEHPFFGGVESDVNVVELLEKYL